MLGTLFLDRCWKNQQQKALFNVLFTYNEELFAKLKGKENLADSYHKLIEFMIQKWKERTSE